MGDTCKGCGRTIVWGVDGKGTRIPLDPRAPVYRMTGEFAGDMAHVNRDTMALVTHFATCPQADRFSKKGQTVIGAALEKARRRVG